jgi:O-antigen/teichoic acid export membrane protein
LRTIIKLNIKSNIQTLIFKLKHSPLFKDSMWSLTGSVLGQGLSLIAGIVVARFLGKDIYGEYGMIKTTLINIAVFSTFGLGYTATKFIAESKNNNKQSIKQIALGSIHITLVTSIFFALLLFVFSRQVAIYLNAEHLSFSLRIFAATIIFNALTTVQIGILAGFNEFKAIAKNKIIVGIITFVLSVVLTYFGDIEGALSALLIATVLNCVLNNIVVHKQLRQYPQSECKPVLIIKKLIAFSLPLTLQEAVYSITSWLNILLLVKLSNYGEIGLYSAAMQWSSIILFIPGVLRNVTLSHLAGNKDDLTQHNKVFKRMILVNFISTLLPCLTVFLLSEFISLFYGESFKRLPLILNISVFTTIFGAVINVYSQEYLSKNMTWRLLFITLFRFSSPLIITYYLIMYNYCEGACGLMLSVLIMSILTVIILHIDYTVKNRNYAF